MVKNDLAKFFITKSEATEFSNGLSAIIGQIYQTGFSLEQALIYQFGVEKKDIFLTMMRDEEANWQDSSNLNKYLTGLQEKISKLPTISLTTAFVPKADTLTKISDWLALNIGSQLTIEISVDKSLVGGATINYKGKFSDGSIKNKFMEAAYGSKL